MVLPRIRVVPTASGARAVQVIWHYRDNKPVLITSARLTLTKNSYC
ncbi:hypothetical protein [Tessaracoccus sp.]|nr:hypothetical protein [Tessaracoccus sp.]